MTDRTDRPADQGRRTYQNCVTELTAKDAPFELKESSFKGVPMRDFVNRPQHLSELLDSIEAYGARECLVYKDTRLSYRDFVKHVKAFAGYLIHDLGVKRGDPIALFAFNRPEWIIAFWGVMVAGGVNLALNSWWTENETQQALETTRPKILICDTPCFLKLGTLPNSVRKIIHMDGRPTNGSADVEHSSFDKAVHLGRSHNFPAPHQYSQDDAAAVFFTSGTTGHAKGVVISHRAWIVGLMNAALAANLITLQQPNLDEINSDIIILATLPFFHIGGGHGIVLGSIIAGHTIVIAAGKFDPDTILKLIVTEKITRWSAVPAMVRAVCMSPNRNQYDVSSLSSLAYGAAPSAAKLQQLAYLTFPGLKAVTNAFGMSETGSVFAMNTGADYQSCPSSIGRAFPTADVRIVDDNAQILPKGEVGELYVRGLFLMDGYWGEDTSVFTDDQYLPTGDLAMIDENGFIFIKGRKKDIIIRGGENIYAGEIEARLEQHPGVVEAAVIGIADPKFGEIAKAVIRRNADVTADELKNWVGAELAHFKIPGVIEFTETPLARNAAGKLLKRHIKEL